jgi:hypothetical protein
MFSRARVCARGVALRIALPSLEVKYQRQYYLRACRNISVENGVAGENEQQIMSAKDGRLAWRKKTAWYRRKIGLA